MCRGKLAVVALLATVAPCDVVSQDVDAGVVEEVDAGTLEAVVEAAPEAAPEEAVVPPPFEDPVTVSGDRLRGVALRSPDGATQHLNELWYDTVEGYFCRVGRAPDRTVRCIPVREASVSYRSDPACTVRIGHSTCCACTPTVAVEGVEVPRLGCDLLPIPGSSLPTERVWEVVSEVFPVSVYIPSGESCIEVPTSSLPGHRWWTLGIDKTALSVSVVEQTE